jgi:BMFP domain-containing protein YqiC
MAKTERRNSMHGKNKKDNELSEVWTSVDDAPREVQKEYERHLKKVEEQVDDLDNQSYSEGEQYD